MIYDTSNANPTLMAGKYMTLYDPGQTPIMVISAGNQFQ